MGLRIATMSKVFGACLWGTLVAVMCCAPRESEAAQIISSVGSISRAYLDDKRMNWERTAKRPMNTVIWYPTEASPGEPRLSPQSVNPLFVPLPPTAVRRVHRCRPRTRGTH